ncbi:MAG: hypothetical protein IPP74_14640 [Alphaproteobacteria bacterium]|nr:hypothetical protein [Alphaproteobacteria bacterium]
MAELGRPSAITEDVLRKLEEVFALGGTDKEACLYANIAPSTLYKYQEENKDFTERKEALKETPVLKARRTVFNSLETDVNSAWKYVERKDPDLNPKQTIDHTNKGEKFEPSTIVADLTTKLNAIHRGASLPSDGGSASPMDDKASD